jgi:hypothetical protein
VNWLQAIKEKFNPPAKGGQPLWAEKGETVERELQFFKDTFRVGILTHFTTIEDHDEIMRYKKELDNLGYETEVLMFVNAKENPRNIFVPVINLTDLNKQQLPYSPRTDRYVKKKFDMLFNLFFEDSEPLKYLAKQSIAKCRYGAFRPHLMDVTDVFVYTEPEDDLKALIKYLNETLQKQKYAKREL